MPSPLCRVSLLLPPVVFEVSASLILFPDYNFLLMSHFFACFLDAVRYPPPLLHSWAVALVVNASHCICPWAHGLASCQTIHLKLAGVVHRVLLNFGGFFFFSLPLQHFKFPAVKSPILFFWGGNKKRAMRCLAAFSLLIEPRIIQNGGTTFCSRLQLGARGQAALEF